MDHAQVSGAKLNSFLRKIKSMVGFFNMNETIITLTWISAFLTLSLCGVLFLFLIINGIKNWRKKKDFIM